MAEWRGLSNHQKAFKANRERASEAAAGITAQFVESMTGSAIAEREAAEEAAEGTDFDLVAASQKLLRSRRRKDQDAEAERVERSERLSEEHAATQKGAGKKEPSQGRVGKKLSPSQFARAVTKGFSSDEISDLIDALDAPHSAAMAREYKDVKTLEQQNREAVDEAMTKGMTPDERKAYLTGEDVVSEDGQTMVYANDWRHRGSDAGSDGDDE